MEIFDWSWVLGIKLHNILQKVTMKSWEQSYDNRAKRKQKISWKWEDFWKSFYQLINRI